MQATFFPCFAGCEEKNSDHAVTSLSLPAQRLAPVAVVFI